MCFPLAAYAVAEQTIKQCMDLKTKQQIENNFTYHPPKDGQPEKYVNLREKAKELAYLIAETVPPSREQSLALTNLEQAIFWANAGVARN